MIGILARRLATSLLLLFLILTATFFLIHLVPGDPALLFESPRFTREQAEHLRRLYGLDRPLLEQYLSWLGAVARGDWGVSFAQQRPALAVILQALPNTFLLATAAVLIQYGLGLVLGVSAARHHGRGRDHAIRVGSLFLYSLPAFWLATMAILLFSHAWGLFPPSHMRSVEAMDLGFPARQLDVLHHLVLPAAVLGLSAAGGVVRFVRNSLLEVLGRDFMRTARAKGLPEGRVIWLHGMRNALAPVIQLFGMSLPALLNGSLIVEVVFSWPGVGQITYNACLARDYPVVLAGTALSALLVIGGNLLADMLHGAVDPRVRHHALA